ncbi:uncharacterized protein C14orf119 [Bombus pyrosoma]|uniref:uncharacterized protein C14orf119 n=1 Tax=Bombus pyrosoma TaxID=396416 RepID=UPI001CB8CCE3|nr:uncharacterized protein C14orf119 [Bombus pyrosoma]XP_043581591.1 uncharacterized protein C14orf119 [Bombus pyrosoma]XP_043581592.1 uncharacterized protein C14orf119 [Bombus pyrosoma]
MTTILTNEAKLRYVIEWFQEWSEMQRNDFLDILIEECGPVGLVHGLVSRMENLGNDEDLIYDRPTLFRCRVKLFREWSYNWSRQEKDFLLLSIKSADAAFAQKYDEKLLTLIRDEHEKQYGRMET